MSSGKKSSSKAGLIAGIAVVIVVGIIGVSMLKRYSDYNKRSAALVAQQEQEMALAEAMGNTDQQERPEEPGAQEESEKTGAQETAEGTGSQGEPVASELSETDAPKSSDPNGFGFSISQNCLDQYLKVANYGDTYYDAEEKKADGAGSNDVLLHHYEYFSICGMAGDEPFMLLSSTDDIMYNADEVYFVRYTPEYASEGTPEKVISKDWISCDNLSFHQTILNNGLYVYTTELAGKSVFFFTYHYQYNDSFDSNNDTFSYENFDVRYRNNKLTRKLTFEGENVAQTLVDKGTIAPIKWFSRDQIDEARAYYTPYVRTEERPQDTANRDDYYTSLPLKYFDYLTEEDAVFETKEENGATCFVFSMMEMDVSRRMYGSFSGQGAQTLIGGSSSKDVCVYVFRDETGAARAICTSWHQDSKTQKGVVEIFEATSTNQFSIQVAFLPDGISDTSTLEELAAAMGL